MDDLKLTELLVKAYSAAPPHIQEFIDDERLDDFMVDLQTEKKLRADDAGVIADQLLLTLLGVIDPSELATTLKSDTNLTESQVRQVLEEVNRSIFVPLREKTLTRKSESTQNETSISTRPAARLVAQSPRPASWPVSVSRPAPMPVTPQSQRLQASQQQTPLQARPVISVPPQQKPTPPAPAQKPVSPVPTTSVPQAEEAVPTHPAIRTMMRDADEAQHPAPPVQKPTPSPSVPAVTPPRIATPPVTTPSFNKKSTTPTPNASDLADTLKKYGIDPYREPVE